MCPSPRSSLLSAILFGLCTGSVSAVTYDVPPSAAPAILLAGEELSIFDGAILPPTFEANSGSVINVFADSLSFTRFYTSGEINIRGGAEVGINALDPNSSINVYDGIVAGGSSSFGGVVTNVYGGKIGFNFSMWKDVLNVFDGAVDGGLGVGMSSVNVYGGTVGMPEGVFGSRIHVFAGAFPEGFLVGQNSVFTAFGGSFGPMFRVNDEAEVHLIGTEFSVAAQPIDGLQLGASVIFDQRDVVLTARLRDGTLIELDLDSAVGVGPSWFSPKAVLRLSLVPEPHTALLALAAFVGAAFVARNRTE